MGRDAMRMMGGRGVGEFRSGGHSYGRMGGVISEEGWLSLRGAAPRRFSVAPYNADV